MYLLIGWILNTSYWLVQCFRSNTYTQIRAGDTTSTRDCISETRRIGLYFFSLAPQPLVGQGLRIEASRSHSDTPRSVGLLSPTQEPLSDSTQHSQETDIYAPGVIRTRNPSKRTAADPRLRPHGHWDRHMMLLHSSLLRWISCCPHHIKEWSAWSKGFCCSHLQLSRYHSEVICERSQCASPSAVAWLLAGPRLPERRRVWCERKGNTRLLQVWGCAGISKRPDVN